MSGCLDQFNWSCAVDWETKRNAVASCIASAMVSLVAGNFSGCSRSLRFEISFKIAESGMPAWCRCGCIGHKYFVHNFLNRIDSVF